MKCYPNDWLLLAGFVDKAKTPNFLIPVFTNGSDFFMQHEDGNGIVSWFSRVRVANLERLEPNGTTQFHQSLAARTLRLGDRALYAFSDEQGIVWIEDKHRMMAALKDWVRTRRTDPMLFLEIAEFCGLPKSTVVNAILRATEYLRQRQLPQADRWAAAEFRRLGARADIDVKRQGVSKFFRSVPSSDATLPILPLIHKTDAFSLERILQEKKLTPTADATSRVVRTSYGSIGDLGSMYDTIAASLPVLLVLSGRLIDQSSLVLPFSTHLFYLNRESFHSRMTLEDFSIPPHTEAVVDFVAWFYGGNDEYLGFELRNIDYPPSAFELDAYLSAVKSQSRTSDDRLRTIEVSFDQPIELSDKNLEAVIVPSFVLDVEAVGGALSQLDTFVIPYQVTPGINAQYLHALNHHLRSYYLERGYIYRGGARATAITHMLNPKRGQEQTRTAEIAVRLFESLRSKIEPGYQGEQVAVSVSTGKYSRERDQGLDDFIRKLDADDFVFVTRMPK